MPKIVAIVGRPNVGKSTLFNRFTESRTSIVHETSGVTRDRIYGKALWNGVEFSVIDTGGYVDNSDDIFEEEINRQVRISIEEADIILFMVDVEGGITDLDMHVAELLRRSNKKVIVAVNKVDTGDRMHYIHEFHALGLGNIHAISSSNGSGTGDLLDEIVASFPKEEERKEEEEIPRFAIIGRPNVGKSSLTNTLLGENRNIVTPLAGTTRDSIDSRYKKYGHDFTIIDTAGLRKKGKVHDNLEFYSVMRAVRIVENSDVCLLLIDATRGIEGQDVNIFRLVERNHKGIVILVNKWDLVEKDHNTTREFEKNIREKLEPFVDVPIIFTSAITKIRLRKVLDTAMQVYNNRMQKIPTSRLNEVLLEAIEKHHPPAVKGKHIKIKYVTQLRSHAPAFAFFCNLPQYIKDPYKRYLENSIRKNFNFTGVPIQIFFRKK
ncbi:MAG: ribosome biogenesis GTPase Der [Bacteroidota bacterium]